MTIAEYKKQIIDPLRQATLVFLLKEDKILLAMKKRGFGMGHWNGVGGKVEPGETSIQAAIRETEEEIGVKVFDLDEVAKINFYFPHVDMEKKWDQQVVVYLAKDWSGEPVETEEMRPEWTNVVNIPYNEMWSDDIIWLPEVLAGNKIFAEMMFDENKDVLDYKLNEI